MEKVKAFVPTRWKPQEKVVSGERRKILSWSSGLIYEPVVMVCHGEAEAQEQRWKERDERRARKSSAAIFLLSGELCLGYGCAEIREW